MRSFGVIDRMVIRGFTVPFLLAFFVYTFLLMIRSIFSLMEQVFVRGMPAVDAVSIVLATVPHVIVLTIPMSFLFGVLIAVGRMNGDNEIVAMQAAGISTRRLVRPIVLGGMLLFAFNAYLFINVIPESANRLREIKTAVFTSSRNIGVIEARVFFESFPNLLLYVKDVDHDTGIWSNVLLYDTRGSDVERLTLARRGRIVVPENREPMAQISVEDTDPWLLLEDVITREFLRDKPSTYRVNATERQMVRLGGASQSNVSYRIAMRERPTAELLELMTTTDDDAATDATSEDSEAVNGEPSVQDRRAAGIEFHRRLAIPAACLAFGLLALPLGIGSGSGSKGRGFVLSIVVILVYYLATNNGELLALEGKVSPWFGMWFPNICLVALAVFLMTRMGRWIGERDSGESLFSRSWNGAIQWIQRSLRPSSASRGGSHNQISDLTGSIPVKLQRRKYGTRFPSLFDRHLSKRLMTPLLLVLLTTSALYIVVEISSNLEDMAKNHVSADVIISYCANLIPQVITDVLPVGLMIAVLVLLTLMERQRELTAFKGAGISLYRVMVPIILVGVVATGVLWLLGESTVPKANREAKRLLDRIRGRDNPRSYRVNDRMWLLSRDGSTFYKFLQYDEDSQTLLRLTMFRLDDNMSLRFHLSTHRARYSNGSWIADSGWFRQFYPDGSDRFDTINAPLELGILETPNYFGQEHRQPAEMSFPELRAYVRELVDSGYNPVKLMVRMQQKLAYPLSALILVILSLPFGLNRGGRRVTTMQGVALALFLGLGYFVVVAMFQKMGEAGLLPPTLAAWAPVLLASLFAINRMTALRS